MGRCGVDGLGFLDVKGYINGELFSFIASLSSLSSGGVDISSSTALEPDFSAAIKLVQWWLLAESETQE